jgi:hypothetical protein
MEGLNSLNSLVCGGGGGGAAPAKVEEKDPQWKVAAAVLHGWLGKKGLDLATEQLWEALFPKSLEGRVQPPLVVAKPKVQVSVDFGGSGMPILRDSFSLPCTVLDVLKKACKESDLLANLKFNYTPEVFFVMCNGEEMKLTDNLQGGSEIMLLVIPLINVKYLSEKDIVEQDGDNIPLNFGVNIEGQRVAVSFTVAKDRVDVFDNTRLHDIAQDEINQIT